MAMKLTIVTPESATTVANVDRVSVPGSAGRFVVLQGHAPLASTMTAGVVQYRHGGQEEALAVSGGVVRVERNEVCVAIEQ
jgi:F-type H+-transporting ATPase subunit epsilon